MVNEPLTPGVAVPDTKIAAAATELVEPEVALVAAGVLDRYVTDFRRRDFRRRHPPVVLVRMTAAHREHYGMGSLHLHRKPNTMSITTQTEHDPETLFGVAEEFRAAQLAGDRARLHTVLSEDVTWVLAGDNTVSGEARGVAEVFARFDQLAHYGVHVGIEHITIGRDGAALIMHNTGEHDGRILDEHLVSTMTVIDGQIVRIDTYLSDLDMMNAYFI